MAGWKSRVGKLALVLAATLVAGCPLELSPSLSATPGAIDFGAEQTASNISLRNLGGGTLEWTAQTVTRANVDAPWTPGDIPWLTLSATSGSIGTANQNLTLTASRQGLSSGLYTNTGVEITSNGGTVTVPVSITVQSALRVSPSTVSLSATDTSAAFTIQNNGNAPLNWSLAYLPDPEDPETIIAFPPGFTVSPGTGTTQASSSTPVTLTFPAGRQSFGVLVNSNSGSERVTFRIGAGLTGFLISPSTLRVSNAGASAPSQPASILTIENTGSTPINWTIRLADRLDSGATPPLAATPIVGSTAVGAASEVSVRITAPGSVIQGDGRYELIVRSGEAFHSVPIVIDVLPLPQIVLSRPPDRQVLQPPVVRATLLDFGIESIQQQFWVVNTGSVDSELFFEVTHDDRDAARPLIASVSPLRGNTNGPDQDFFLPDQQSYTDGVPVTVTIDRSALVEDVETRTITVRAFDRSFSNRVSTVEPVTIQVRVEKQPFVITGALNRSRPPNLLRFVFSNRDDLGRIVPLQTRADRDRLAYDIFEDEIPLDLNETSQFLTFDYRGNVVLMLDYTGSMYRAGTTGENALRNGEAVELMREAARAFIDDLPPNFQLQLMYFSDRTREDRVIQPFTRDRQRLRDALDRFTLSPALFGVSDIYDALGEAMRDLAEEDPAGVLPFDDADVRAVVFITDGEDNVSGLSLSDVQSRAEETRTRLFPVTYSPNGDPVNIGDMLELSSASGGYLYSVSTVADLRNALGTRSNMRLLPQSGTFNGRAGFLIENFSPQAIFYEVTRDGSSPWLGAITEPTGVVAGNASKQITVALNPGDADPGTLLQGALRVTAGNGNGTVAVQFRAGANNSVSNVATAVRDEPGTIWEEFNNQSVVTYMTPKEAPFAYLLSGRYRLDDGRLIEGAFERDGTFFIGDPIAGQVSLRTAGIFEDLTTVDPEQRYRAEVYVYADYVPRNVTAFSFRFHLVAPDDIPAESAALLDGIRMQVALAADGILADDNVGTADWRLISDGEGRYRIITDEENSLPIGSFGNLLKLTFTNLGDFVSSFGNGARQPEFQVAMRMDNQIYVSPASERQPSGTKFFLYPGGLANANRRLSVEFNRPDIAAPAEELGFLSGIEGFDPESAFAFDIDEDSFPDFNDPFPFDDQRPGTPILPNPFEIAGNVNTFTLTVRNTTLDRFNWAVNAATLPAWLPASQIRYGEAMGLVPRSTLLPGESETVHFVVDRSGQTPGTTETALVEFDLSSSEYTFFVPESIPITLITNP
ncbi:MAG: hypothetical protein KF886_07290 [Candidatus Hydrogenedentes bacterium]|nr:hypothetical protein [Candidatus Hydrogenedentota bacterium]